MPAAMRRFLPLVVLALAGCTNAPGAGLLDCTFPSRPKRDRTPERDVRPPGTVPDVGPRGPAVPGGSDRDPPAPPIPPPAGLDRN